MANEVGALNSIAIEKIGSVNSIVTSKIGAVNALSYVTEIPQDLSTGLVGYFNFEETSGTTLTNRKGANASYPNGIAVNSPVMAQTGKSGYSWDIYGTRHVNLGDNGYQFSGDFTISAWVMPLSSLTDATRSIFSRYWPTVGYRCYFLTYMVNKLHFRVWNTSNVEYTAYYNAILPNSTWTHVVASKLGSNMAIYINDVSTGVDFQQVNNAPASIRVQAGGGTNVKTMIGAMSRVNNTPDYYWDGRMDEIGVWNRGLTAPQVAYLYNDGVGRFYTPATGFV